MRPMPSLAIAVMLALAGIQAASSAEELEMPAHLPRLSPPPLSVTGVAQPTVQVEKGRWNDYSAHIPADWVGKRVKLYFRSPTRRMTLKIGDKRIKPPKVAGCDCEIDITDLVTPGEDFTYRMDNRSPCRIEARALPPVNLAQLEARASFEEGSSDANLKVLLAVANESPEPVGDVQVRFRLLGPDGTPWECAPTEHRIADIPAGETARATLTLAVPDPLRWDCDHPHLYHLQATLSLSGEQQQVAERRFGFREIRFSGQELLVNGRPVKLAGAHMDPQPIGIDKSGKWSYPRIGLEESRRIVSDFRQANVNHLRLRNTSAPTVEACDEVGMFCQVELPYGMIRGDRVSNPSNFPQMIRFASHMASTYYSNPSVLLVSLGNEPDIGPLWTVGTKVMHRFVDWGVMLSTVRQPVDGSGRNARRWNIIKDFDVQNQHYPSTSAIREKPNNGRIWLFDEIAHLPIHLGGDDQNAGTIDEWARILQAQRLGLVVSAGALGGAIFHGYGYESSYGLFDCWGRRTSAWWHTKKVYTPIYIADPGKPLPPGKRVRVPVTNRSLFSDLAEFTFAWSVGERHGEVEVSLAPQASGELEIPVAVSEGDVIDLRVTGPQGFEVDRFRFAVGRRQTPTPPAPTFAGAIAVERSGDTIDITGTGFSWQVDAATGQIVEGRIGDVLAVVGGPKFFLNSVATEWQPASVAVKREDQAVVVDVTGACKEAAATYSLRFGGDGSLEIPYRLESTGAVTSFGRAGGFREVGLLIELPMSYDELAWERQGVWTTWPEQHAGRASGTAPLRRVPDSTVVGGERISGRAQKPPDGDQYPWRLNETHYGTLDFSSTKQGMFFATLSDDEGHQVATIGDGTTHSRCRAAADHIQFIVEVFFGSTGWQHTQWSGETRHLRFKKGEGVEGRPRFVLRSLPAGGR